MRLLRIKDHVRRLKLEHLDGSRNGPAMRGSTSQKLPLCFGESDVESAFAFAGTFYQVAERQRRLSGPGLSFNQEKTPFCKSPGKDAVEDSNTRCSIGSVTLRALLTNSTKHNKGRQARNLERDATAERPRSLLVHSSNSSDESAASGQMDAPQFGSHRICPDLHCRTR